MASTQTKNSGNRKTSADRQNTNALIQWIAVAAVITLGIAAVFVFEIGGSSHGGVPGVGGHGGVIQLF